MQCSKNGALFFAISPASRAINFPKLSEYELFNSNTGYLTDNRSLGRKFTIRISSLSSLKSNQTEVLYGERNAISSNSE